MKIETQPIEDQQIKITVEVDKEPIEQAKRKAARDIAKRTKIPGFRPGKAPFQVIQRAVGEEALFEESLDVLIKDLYPSILEQGNVHPSGPGRLEKILSREPLSLVFIVPLEPDVVLGDYHSIRFPYELRTISEEEVDEVIDDIRERQAVEEPVERAIGSGDKAFIKLSAIRVTPQEGEPEFLIREDTYPFVIPDDLSKEDDDWPFPSFLQEVTGMSAGDAKTIRHTFAADYDIEEIRGNEYEFRLRIEEVKSRSLPEINDEFAHTVGEYQDLNRFRAEIRNSLEKEARDAYHRDYDQKVVNHLVEKSIVKYPPQMLQVEIDEVLHDLEHRLERQKLDMETYLKTQNMDETKLREEARPVAEARLKRSLVLLNVAEREKIEVSSEEVQQEAEQTLEAMTRFMTESELRKVSNRDLLTTLVGNIMAELRVTRTLEYLRNIARAEEQPQLDTSATEEQDIVVPEVEVAPVSDNFAG